MVRYPIVCRILALFNLILYLGFAYVAYLNSGNDTRPSNPSEKTEIDFLIFMGTLFLIIIISNIVTLAHGESNLGHFIFLFVATFFTVAGSFLATQVKDEPSPFINILILVSITIPTLLIVLFGKPTPASKYNRPYYSNNGPYTQPNSDAYE